MIGLCSAIFKKNVSPFSPQEDAGVTVRFVRRQPDQIFPDLLNKRFVVIAPGAPVPEHRRLHGFRRGEGSQHQQQIRVVRQIVDVPVNLLPESVDSS